MTIDILLDEGALLDRPGHHLMEHQPSEQSLYGLHHRRDTVILSDVFSEISGQQARSLSFGTLC